MLRHSYMAVSSAALRATFNNMTGDGAGGYLVPIIRAQPKLVHQRRKRQTGVSSATCDYNLRATIESFTIGAAPRYTLAL
jgi:hypothetical protein